MLDLSLGPYALFREFAQIRRNDIRRGSNAGSVDLAKSRDDVSAYYAVYVDWARRRFLPITGEEEFQEVFAAWRNRRLLLAGYT